MEEQDEAGGGPHGAIDSLIIMVKAVVNYESQNPLAIMQSKWKLKMAQVQDKSRICELRD